MHNAIWATCQSANAMQEGTIAWMTNQPVGITLTAGCEAIKPDLWPQTWTVLTLYCHVMHKCVGNVTITGSDNGLLPDWHQAII